MFIFFNPHLPVPVPGLLDKETIAVYFIDVIAKYHGIGNIIIGDLLYGKGNILFIQGS